MCMESPCYLGPVIYNFLQGIISSENTPYLCHNQGIIVIVERVENWPRTPRVSLHFPLQPEVKREWSRVGSLVVLLFRINESLMVAQWARNGMLAAVWFMSGWVVLSRECDENKRENKHAEPAISYTCGHL